MIPDDELQANADATLPDFYGPTKWPVEILVPTKELAEMRDEITRLKAENEKLTAELATWKPMTPEEAEAALDAAVGIPISDEEIDRIVAKVTDPAYRPPESEHVLMAAKIEQLRAELAAKEIRWTERATRIIAWLRAADFGEDSSGRTVFRIEHGPLAKIKKALKWSDKPISQPEERT